MLIFFLRQTEKDSKPFKIKVKFSDVLSEQEKKKLLFEVFDLALADRKKTESKKQRFKGQRMHFLTTDTFNNLFLSH